MREPRPRCAISGQRRSPHDRRSQSYIRMCPTPATSCSVATSSIYYRVIGQKSPTTASPGSYNPLDRSTWSKYTFHPCFKRKALLLRTERIRLGIRPDAELFECTDKIAGIGYASPDPPRVHKEEVLLTRAGHASTCARSRRSLADLSAWDVSRWTNLP